MSEEGCFQSLKEVYYNAPCNEYFKPEINISRGAVEIYIEVRKDLFHALGAVHSTAYYKAIDDAAIFSAQSILENEHVLTTSFNLFVTRPVSKGVMTAKGRVVNTAKSQIIAEAVLYDSEGNELARGTGSFARREGSLTKIAAEHFSS